MSVDAERLGVISGFRPTSDLTVGNYLGAVKPSLDIQGDPTKDLYIFVADLHALTDHDPREVGPYRRDVIHDCLALGIDPDLTTIYLQSSIEEPVTMIANRVAPYVSVSELARTPNLKEKMQTAVRKGESEDDDSLSANFGLLGYPVLMAADIYAQETLAVAVGKDQEPHLELARKIASRFNRKFKSSVLVVPRILSDFEEKPPKVEGEAEAESEGVKVLGLDGKGKMSKTNPNQAIILTDDPDEARRKIKKGATAVAGKWNEAIASHFMVAENTTSDEAIRQELRDIESAHLQGKNVMGQFKNLWGDITEKLLLDFQARKAEITAERVDQVIADGATKAGANANRVLSNMRDVMGF